MDRGSVLSVVGEWLYDTVTCVTLLNVDILHTVMV